MNLLNHQPLTINHGLSASSYGDESNIANPLAALRARRAEKEETGAADTQTSTAESQVVTTYYSESRSDDTVPPSINIVMDGVIASTKFVTDRTETTTSETSQGSIRRRRGESGESDQSEAVTEVTEDSAAFEALLEELTESAAGLAGIGSSSLPEEGSDSGAQALLQTVAASLPMLEAEQVDPTGSGESAVQESQPRPSLDTVA